MAGIQVSGLVSGIDTGSIIDQLMAVEKAPRTKITNAQEIDGKKVDLLNDLNTKLTTLKSANDDLRSVLSWLASATRTADGPLEIDNADGTVRTTVNLKAGATVDDAVSAINGSPNSSLYA